MKSLLLIPVVLTAIGLQSATSVAPAPVAAAPAVTGGPNDWVVNTVHSSVIFKIKHVGAAWFYGAFKDVSGEINLDPQKPETGSIKVEIATDSVDTRNSKRDDHLKSPDFFNAKENPKFTFTSSKIQKKGDAFEVTGDIELHGKKQSITTTVTKVGEGQMMGKVAGFETTFTLKRSDFGITGGAAGKGLGDEVTVIVSLEADQKK
jgi:polyisoprenoid-binding protein YceI